MKTEQEQIEQIEKVLKYAVADYKHLKKKGEYYCYAETLIDHGYGDVSEYKAEIERLRTTLGQCNTELNSALESLKSQCREIGKLKAGTKQAQIDVLNKVKDIVFDYLGVKNIKEAEALSLLDSTLTYDVVTCGIDELIKEVENEQKD